MAIDKTGPITSARPMDEPPSPQGMSAPMRALFVELARMEALYPDSPTLSPQEGRRIFEQRHARWNQIDISRLHIERFEIPRPEGPDDAIRAVRIQSVDKATPGKLLYLHGGGWTYGTLNSFMGIMSHLAERTGLAVYGIEYALAPEHPFPSGLADCLTAWRWLSRQAPDNQPTFIAGDSAGANLALSMMIDLRDMGETQAQAAALVYGVYCGEEEKVSHRLFGQGQFGLTMQRMLWFLNNYRANGVNERERPRLFPAEADLHDLPPMLVIAAELDPLRDDSVTLAAKLAQTETPFEFQQVDGVIHNFLHWSEALPEAAATLDRIAAFIGSHIGAR